MNRENGFYWVKYEGDWIIAEWDERNHKWLLTGVQKSQDEEEFEEVEEVKLQR